MITNLEKLKRVYEFDFLSFNHNKITGMVEIKAGKFDKRKASKGIWIDVDEALLIPGVYKLTEIDKLTGIKKIMGERTITKEETKKHLKTVMKMLKKQYENVMEDSTFKELEEDGLVQRKGFDYVTSIC